MPFYYQSGEGLNLLARAAAVKAPTAPGTVDANFPLANLYDGRPSQYTRWSAATAWTGVTFDLNLIPNGDGESTDFSGWTVSADVGTGELLKTDVSPYSGAGSIRLCLLNVEAGTHWVVATRLLRLRAGEKLRIYEAGRCWSADAVEFYLKDLETGQYLQSNGTWTASQIYFARHTDPGWLDGYVNLQLPSAEASGGTWHRCRLEIVGRVNSATAIEVRAEVKLIPGWDTVVVLGHQFTPSSAFRFYYQALAGNDPKDTFTVESAVTDWLKTPTSTVAPIPSDEYNLAAVWNKPQATRYERWVRFYMTNAETVNTAVCCGEILLCQAETLTRRPMLQLSGAHQAAGQILMESGSGDPWVYNRTPIPRGKLTLRFQSFSAMDTGIDAVIRAARYLFVERPQLGVFPVLVIPYEHDPRMVIYGRPRNELAYEHIPPQRTWEIEVQDYPIPGLHQALSPT